MIENEYPEHQTRNQLQDCEMSIKNLKTDVYKEMLTNLKTNSIARPISDCIIDYLKIEHWAEIQMKFAVYDASQLPIGERRKKTEELRELSEREPEFSVKYCQHEPSLGALFEELIQSDDSNDEDDRLTEYCTRKYLIDNAIIDTHVYNVTLDTNGIDLSTSNCGEIIENLMKEGENALIESLKEEDPDASQNEVACMLKRYRDGNYIEKLMKVAVLGNLDLDNNQRIKERRDFIKFVTGIVDEVSFCFRLRGSTH